MTTGSEAGRGEKRKSTEEDTGDRDISLQDAVDYFISCSTRPKLRGNIRLQVSLERVESIATETGLPADVINTLLPIAANGIFPESVCSRLIKSLIPATVVPYQAVRDAVSSMCTNKPSSNIQTLLIRWLVLVYESLERTEELHALYGILFYFLSNESMCRHVCHLLYLLTRKEDVRLLRVRNILILQRKMGPQPYLQGLLYAYKIYHPKYITLSNKTHRVFFRQTDRIWASKVRAVLDRRRVDRPIDNSLHGPHFFTSQAPPTKRGRVEVIPALDNNNVNSSVYSQPSKSMSSKNTTPESVPFSQISSFETLLHNLDRLALPSQIAAALKHRNLQHVLLCHTDPAIATRIAHWLDHVLYEEFLMNPSADKQRGEDLLAMLIKFSEFLKEGVPVCENFLRYYLHIWNGVDFRVHILKLTTRFRLHPFAALNDVLLEPLHKLFFCSSVHFKCQVLMCLTQLLRNFTQVELPRYKYCLQRQKDAGNLSTSIVDDTGPNTHCVFSEEVQSFCPEEVLVRYIEYVDGLATVGLDAEKNNALLMHCVLNFYELVSDLHRLYGVPFVCLPNRSIVYKALFSSQAMTLSRICHIICRYRDDYLLLRGVPQTSLTESNILLRAQSLHDIQTLNCYLLDFCDSLWRHRAFTSQERDTVYKLLADTDHFTKLRASNNAFSLHNHVALLGFVKRFMKKNLPPGDHQPSMIKQHRDEFLQFLSLDHVTGVPNFIAVNISRKSSSH